MPYLVTCPNCATKLKSGQPVPAGRAVTCPQCKTTFTLTAPAPAIDAPPPAAAPPGRPAPPPPPARPAPAAARRTRDDEDDRPRSRRRADDEDDDRPRSRRRDADDEDERPRGKRRPADEEDEDERPRGRRRPADEEDEEEDRPKSRRRREEDDDDRPPKSRKRPDADEDEEDQPRSRKGRGTDDFDDDEDDDRPRGRGKKKGKKGLILILGGLAALFLLCAGGGLAMYFLDPFGMFGGGASSDMLAWMPADTQTVEGIDVAEVSKNPKALTAVRGDLKDVEAIGIKAEDVATAVQGKKGGGKGVPAEVVVVRLKSAADKDKVKAAAGGTEATANGKKYFKTKAGGGLYFASDKLVILTRSESTLTGLLQKDDGKVVVSDELKGAVKRADGDLWAASVGADANMFGGAGGGGGAKGGFPGFVAPPPPKNTVMTGKLAGDDVNMRLELAYADAETAKKAADAYEAVFKLFKGMLAGMEQMFGKAGPPNAGQAKMQGTKKMFDTMKITTSGSMVVITMTGPIDALDSFGKGGGFGGP